MNDEVVTRLYRCLVEELRRRGHDEERPLKVSELYQDLIPYKAVRSTLGVELNADYEHALLRLLSGERGLVRLEPQQARAELEREVDAPYPFVGLFRKYSASDVWVSMNRIAERPTPPAPQPAPPASEARPAPAPIAPRPGSRPDETAPASAPVPRIAAEGGEAPPLTIRGGAVPVRAPAPVQLHREEAQRGAAERLTHHDSDCVFCGDGLPSGRRVRFCPHCGGDQRLRPCPRCDAVLEREWRYCISCGHEVGTR